MYFVNITEADIWLLIKTGVAKVIDYQETRVVTFDFSYIA